MSPDTWLSSGPILLVVSPETPWSFGAGPIVLAAILLGLYVPRWVRVRRTSTRDAPLWRLVSYLLGVTTLLAAQISPLDALGEQLFIMHMVQHLMLLDVMPILLLLGLNRVLMRPATRRLQRLERRAGVLAHPVFAVVAYIGGMWFWHIPALNNAAASNETVHLLQHITFTNIGILYWWHLMRPIPGRHRFGGMQPVAYMLVTKLGVGLLGMLLTFTTSPIYSFYAAQPRFWGLSAVGDQVGGGALMAIEQSLIMGVALALLFFRGVDEDERRQRRSERLEDATHARADAEDEGEDEAARPSREREDAAAAADRHDPYGGFESVGGGRRRGR